MTTYLQYHFVPEQQKTKKKESNNIFSPIMFQSEKTFQVIVCSCGVKNQKKMIQNDSELSYAYLNDENMRSNILLISNNKLKKVDCDHIYRENIFTDGQQQITKK